MYLLIRFLLIMAVLTGSAYSTMKMYKYILDPHDYSQTNDFYKIQVQERDALRAKVLQNKKLLKENPTCDTRTKLSIDKYLWEYTVRKGDSLVSIAQKELGTQEKVESIITLNKEKYPSLSLKQPFIEVGWVLDLPHKNIIRNSAPDSASTVLISEISTEKMSVITDTPILWGEVDNYDTTRIITFVDDMTYFGVSGPADLKVGDCIILATGSKGPGPTVIDASNKP